MAKFDHFNFLSPIYDSVFGKITPSTLVDLLAVESRHTLLDVGGGTGRIAQRLTSCVKWVGVVDPAMKMLMHAKNKGINAINSTAENLPFKAQTFDRIMMVDALHHVADQKKSIDDLWRLLKPDGTMIIEEPDIKNWQVKIVAFVEKALWMRSHFLSAQQIKSLCDFDDTESLHIHNEKATLWIIIKKKEIKGEINDRY